MRNNPMAKKQTRRQFIKTSVKTAVGIGIASKFISNSKNIFAEDLKSRVIVARNPRAVNDRNQCDAMETTQLFDKTLFSLTGKNNAAEAWASLGLSSKDIVAVKVNCNSWTISLNPHQALISALCTSMSTVIPQNNIIIYERTTGDLESGGFKRNISNTGVRYFGADEGGGFDPKQRLTRIITNTCTKIVNLASMKCAEREMVASLFFKNHIGSLVEEDMSKCHGDQDFMAEVSNRPAIKSKTILNLCDGLRGTYERGVPWYWKGIVISKDAVAGEAAIIGVMNEKRKQEGEDPLELPESILIAEKKYKLGTCDSKKMDIVRLNL
jgi:hypothetical protein